MIKYSVATGCAIEKLCWNAAPSAHRPYDMIRPAVMLICPVDEFCQSVHRCDAVERQTIDW